MKKKVLSIILVVCLLATALVSGTLAYFTDSDEAKNTFELGGVDIEIEERKYAEGKWQLIEDTNLGQLDPIGGAEEWDKVSEAGYAYNKGIFTVNKGDEAYIRNYIAVESIGVVEEQNDTIYCIWTSNADTATHSVYTAKHGCVNVNGLGNYFTVTVGEGEEAKMFDIYVYDTIGNVPVKTGECLATLTTITLQDWVTNEMVAQLGETFEVYTWSEAIQTTGLSHAEAMTALIGTDETLEAHAAALFAEVLAE